MSIEKLLVFGLFGLLVLGLYLWRKRSYFFAAGDVIGNRDQSKYFSLHLILSVFIEIALMQLLNVESWGIFSDDEPIIRIGTYLILLLLIFVPLTSLVNMLVAKYNPEFRKWLENSRKTK